MKAYHPRWGFWRNLKGRLNFRYPYTVFIGKVQEWGFSYNRYSLVLNEDTTTPYSILHLGPYEFFIRPRSTAIDWF